MHTLTGEWLREFRRHNHISQARLAELCIIPQHRLSAFELDNASLSSTDVRKIVDVLSNLEQHKSVVGRKKRYRVHSYRQSPQNNFRAVSAIRSVGNPAYLKDLKSLSIPADPSFTGVSLFSGCGGFSVGLRSAGCAIKGHVEIDNGLSEIYSANFPEVEKIGSDISQVDSKSIERFTRRVGTIDVLFGGPPCQGFSLSGKRDVYDRRNYLFREYMRYVDTIRPKVAVLENVRLMTSMKSIGGELVRDDIIAGFRARGYSAEAFCVNAGHYGVPQHRERVFFVALRTDLGDKPSFPDPRYGNHDTLFTQMKSRRTFADACSDLEYLESGQASADPLHVAVRHPDHVIRWLWDVPEGASAHDNDDPELRPHSGYNTTYKRQCWNSPGATVQTTSGMISGCRNVHPIATRSLTIREAARLQSFPDEYKFVGSIGTIRTGIGNAVPPVLARAIGLHIGATLVDLVKISCG